MQETSNKNIDDSTDDKMLSKRKNELFWKRFSTDDVFTLITQSSALEIAPLISLQPFEHLHFFSRRCISGNEVHLKYFPYYQPNYCMIECAVNASLSLCGCAAFNTPVDDNEVCGIPSITCLNSHYGKYNTIKYYIAHASIKNSSILSG